MIGMKLMIPKTMGRTPAMMMNEVGEELFHFCYGYQIYLIFFFLFIYK